MNFNSCHKSLTSPGSGSGSSDYGFGFGGLNASSSSSHYNQSDYSSLLSEFSNDFDVDTNAFLQDILTSAGVGDNHRPNPSSSSSSSVPAARQSNGYEDWL